MVGSICFMSAWLGSARRPWVISCRGGSSRSPGRSAAERSARAQLVRVADENGIRFPREFGLLLKQMLYFDRYTRLLAPKLSVLSDDRVNRTGRPFAQ